MNKVFSLPKLGIAISGLWLLGNPGSILMSLRMCSLSLEQCWFGTLLCLILPHHGQQLDCLSSSAFQGVGCGPGLGDR